MVTWEEIRNFLHWIINSIHRNTCHYYLSYFFSIYLFYLFLYFLDIASYHYETNEQAKAVKLEAAKKSVPYYLERLDAQVKKNGGYFVGGALTWADFTFVGLLDYLNLMMKEEIIEKYENLKQLKKKVEEIPAIKRWYEKRPANILS